MVVVSLLIQVKTQKVDHVRVSIWPWVLFSLELNTLNKTSSLLELMVLERAQRLLSQNALMLKCIVTIRSIDLVSKMVIQDSSQKKATLMLNSHQ